jgi:acetyl-CoA acetyltransferase
MSRDVFVAGVGMIPFAKPGKSDPYFQMGSSATSLALADAGLAYDAVQQAYVGYVYGDSTAGQRALYEVGMSGIPIINVNNNCSTGSTALFLARQAVASGAADCVLALGFEQMTPGALGSVFSDRPSPFDRFEAETDALVGDNGVPLALRYFGGAGKAHMDQYGTQLSTFAKIRAKASRHAARNPLALFRTEVSEEEVMASRDVAGRDDPAHGLPTHLRRGGRPAGVRSLCAQAWPGPQRAHPRPVHDHGQPQTFEAHDMREVVGFSMAQDAARQVYEQAGISPQDVDVVELHDCFAQNELLTYEALGLCPVGGAEKFVCDGDNTYGGKFVTNPSGGLLSKGHPLGATGLAQCTELVQQLRGRADQRQVANARLALQHNLGLGGACVVTLYERV